MEKTKRRWRSFYVAGGILSVIIVVLIWNRTAPGRDDSTHGTGDESGAMIHRLTGRFTRDRDDANPPRIRPSRSDDMEAGEGHEFPLVDAILADESTSVTEAAAQLHDIVVRADVSLLEREEALAHGLHLNFAKFESIIQDPELPQPLALRYFEEMLNQNQSRDLQVRSCLALMSNQDEEIREEAKDQLAFYIGMEEHTDEPDLLRDEALAFLDDLAKQPVPEEDGVDPYVDIPETAPIERELPDEQAEFDE